MQKAWNILIVIAAVFAICFTIWNVSGLKLKSALNTGHQIVVVDLLRVEAAQRKFVADVLKQEQGPAGMASAFRATGDVVTAARAVAPGAAIAVKQAFLYSEYPDITNQVLKELGLDVNVTSDVDVEILTNETSDIANMLDSVRDRKKGLEIPY
jgi:hypothetical protein